MAYIDTDDFLDLFYVASAGQDKQFIDTVEMVVSNTPAADVVEVRHGKWIDLHDENVLYEQTYKCSICGEWFVFESGTPKENEYNYCPHCGAKMDGHKKMTNYDRIKAMSAEEMAEFICSIYDDNQEPYTADKNIEEYTIPDYDESNIKEWLEMEVEK